MTTTPKAFDIGAFLDTIKDQTDVTLTAAKRRAEHNKKTLTTHGNAINSKAQAIASTFRDLQATRGGLGQAWSDYLKDSSQRMVLFADAMRQYSDTIKKHNDAGAPPVLVFDSETVMDGKDMARPCNYFLLRLLPEKGVKIDDTKRPIVIIDPRAGHGGGIGGFKHDSQVGVAFRRGHPVYFVAFHQEPIPHQTLAMVTDAEAAFIREVERLHPKAPKPVVVGNCQGGWATAILAATHPELTGPIVLNGAPMSYWAGKVGQDLMRYSGGLAGGALPAMMAGDMAGGIFDGAYLVENFEALNPARNWFGKYFDLYQDVDKGVPRFLGFERWWGGFYLLTTEEMVWIVENLFVGNKLSNNTAQLETGRPIDLRNIKAPVICFASQGDNITPPGQALNWIMDTYSSEEEIEVRGQRILYMLHDSVGHLGIFVSSKIANREDVQMAETLAHIEALPPGLYRMEIEDLEGENDEEKFTLSIHRGSFEDIISLTGDRTEEPAFAAVARGSEALTEAYESTLRPLVLSTARPEVGEFMRKTNHMRTSRLRFTSDRPGMNMIKERAEAVREARTPVDDSNPFRQAEKLWGEMVETAWDSWRDARETAIEMTFLNLYMTPWSMLYGAKRNTSRSKLDPEALRHSPEVELCLSKMTEGGAAEALVRTMILIGQTTSQINEETLARASHEYQHHHFLQRLSDAQRQEIIREQTVICKFAREEALETLPKLVSSDAIASEILDAVDRVYGDEAGIPREVFAMGQSIRDMLDSRKSKTSKPEPKKPAQTMAK